MYISYKFGGLLSSTSAVNAAQLCTALGLIHLRSLGGQQVCVSLLLARKDTAKPGELYVGLCHAFLVIIFLNIIDVGATRSQEILDGSSQIF